MKKMKKKEVSGRIRFRHMGACVRADALVRVVYFMGERVILQAVN